MKILYLHGLDSPISEEKLDVLKGYGNVLAPDIDYRANEEIVKTLYMEYKSLQIDAIVGSSMGGFAGFYLSQFLRIPALLFNPALDQRTVSQKEPFGIANAFLKTVCIVLGELDEVVPAYTTFAFLEKNYRTNEHISVKKRTELGHRIPIDVFEEEVVNFFKLLT